MIKHIIFGALAPKKDIREYKARKTKRAFAINIPEEFELEMPAVKNQSDKGSCVAHSISSAIEYFNKLQEGTDVVFSTGYIYGNRRNSNWTGTGMYVDDALNAVVKWGDVPNSLFNYNIEVPEAITKFEEKAFELSPEAFPNRVTEFFALSTDEQRKLNLLQNGPIVFSIQWWSDYYVEKNNNILKHSGINPSSMGYHAMIIYGWNKYGWKFQNSWGTSFGNKGRAILPYETPFANCYGLKDTIVNKFNAKKLAELQQTILELEDLLEQKTSAFEDASEKLTQSQEQSKIAADELKNLIQDKISLTNEITLLKNQLKKAEEQEKQLQLLQTELMEIKRPFKKMPKWLVAVINKILNLFNK